MTSSTVQVTDSSPPPSEDLPPFLSLVPSDHKLSGTELKHKGKAITGMSVA